MPILVGDLLVTPSFLSILCKSLLLAWLIHSAFLFLNGLVGDSPLKNNMDHPKNRLLSVERKTKRPLLLLASPLVVVRTLITHHLMVAIRSLPPCRLNFPAGCALAFAIQTSSQWNGAEVRCIEYY